jgi:CheY-like chemotaxis protein
MTKHRILVADDNRKLAQVIHASLSDQYQVDLVDSSASLERALSQTEYDLLITDINLGGASGTTTARRSGRLRAVRGDEEPRQIAILVITGLDPDDEEVIQAQRTPNVRGVLHKPLDLERLRRRVDELFRNAMRDEPEMDPPELASQSLPHVLVLTDDAEVTRDVSCALEGIGCEVRGCLNAQKALRLCEEQAFDVVLLEFLLDDCTGAEFIKALRESPQLQSWPRLYFINRADVDLALETMDQYPEINGVVNVPLAAGTLQAQIRRCLPALSAGKASAA